MLDQEGSIAQPGKRQTKPQYICDDPLLNPRDSAAEVGLSEPGFWKAVAEERMPRPLYPLPKAPRWRRSELRAAVEATRALPAQQKLKRRTARLAAKANARHSTEAEAVA
jgi:predicted DNA-binding transcriptional regulator AlpA